MKILWTTYAARQAEDAYDYLEGQRPGTGHQFNAALRVVTSRLRRFPHAYPRSPAEHEGEVRNALIRKFGYWVIYEVSDDSAIILAVWPTHRRPGGWQVH